MSRCQGGRFYGPRQVSCDSHRTAQFRVACVHEHVTLVWLCEAHDHDIGCARCFAHPARPHACELKIIPYCGLSGAGLLP